MRIMMNRPTLRDLLHVLDEDTEVEVYNHYRLVDVSDYLDKKVNKFEIGTMIDSGNKGLVIYIEKDDTASMLDNLFCAMRDRFNDTGIETIGELLERDLLAQLIEEKLKDILTEDQYKAYKSDPMYYIK